MAVGATPPRADRMALRWPRVRGTVGRVCRNHLGGSGFERFGESRGAFSRHDDLRAAV
jgi:hypothetical protein